MTLVPLIVFLFSLYSLPVAVVCAIVALCSRQIAWRWWEFVLLVVPFFLWTGLVIVHNTGKSLGNAVYEPFLCGCIACMPILAKTTAARLGWQMEVSYLTAFIVACIMILAVYVFMPALPE
ncbi:MAG: hypothetical protein JW809_17545 [Pirellulales bacterium]|nr:hypothetical protein [Pirellulales bacterium]